MEKENSEKKEKVKFNTNIVIVFDKNKVDYIPYSGIDCFSQHNQEYNNDKSRNKIYNKISRGNTYEDERFVIVKRVLVRPPAKVKVDK
jgi:hypothetical protein